MSIIIEKFGTVYEKDGAVMIDGFEFRIDEDFETENDRLRAMIEAVAGYILTKTGCNQEKNILPVRR